MARGSRLLFGLALLVGCASRGALSPAAASVTLSEDAPPAGLIEVGRVHGQSGKGCGVTGEIGSREGAEDALRNQAVALQASFVQVTSSRSPTPNHQCLEHEYVLDGIAYRAAAKAPLPSAPAPVPPPPSQPLPPQLLNDYEGTAALGRPAAATESSSVVLAIVAGEASPSALSVTYVCSGDDQRANLDVWNEARVTDWHAAGALSFSIKPDAELSLSVSFMDGHGTGYTSKTAQLSPGTWQVVTLPLDKFWHNPFGPPGDQPGAPVDTSRVTAFGFAPQGCRDGHFVIDDFKLVP